MFRNYYIIFAAENTNIKNTTMTVSRKSERVVSIDVLRGIAIFGMILCGQIGWHSGLPAWMFHAQLPPPDYVFNPEVRGITWVDLVFPFFLFSMGAAFPFAMNKKISKGAGKGEIVFGLLKRWLTLMVFSLVIGNTYRIPSAGVSPAAANLMTIAVWVALFLALTRFRFRKDAANTAMNLAGMILLAATGLAASLLPGGRISMEYSDVIIMIMGYVSLFGGLIWLLTRNSHKARWCVFGIILAIKAAASYRPEIFSFMPSLQGMEWIFSFSFLQYLLIAIPGSIVGDMILARKNEKATENGKESVTAAAVCLIALVFQLWGLFTRHIAADAAFTLCAAAAVLFLTYRRKSLWTDIAALGFIILLAGILFDPIDGGIRKDYCNISYLLVTSGMATIATGVLIFLETAYGMRFKALSECGQNPMIAYTVTGFITLPVLSLARLMPAIDSLAYGSPVMGICRGLMLTFIMMGVTVFFTRKKLFWKS